MNELIMSVNSNRPARDRLALSDKLRNSRVFNTGLVSVRAGRLLSGACFTVALILGVAICAVQGPVLRGWVRGC